MASEQQPGAATNGSAAAAETNGHAGGGGGGGGGGAVEARSYPVKRFVYVIANITALSGLIFGYDIGKRRVGGGGGEG